MTKYNVHNQKEFESLNLKLSKNILISFFVKLTGLFLILLSQIYFARVMSIESFGMYSLSLSYFFIFLLFSHMSVDTLSLKNISIFKSQSKLSQIKGFYFSSINAMLILSTIVFFCVICYLFLINNNLDSDLKKTVLLFLFSTPFAANVLLISSFLRSYNYIFYSQFTDSILKPLFLICMIYIVILLNGSLESHMAGMIYLISSVMSFLIINYIFFKKIYSKLRNYEPKPFNRIVKKSFPIFLGVFFYLLISQADILMIGYFLGPSEVGLYAPASRLSSLIFFLSSIFSIVIASEIAIAYENNNFLRLSKITIFSTRFLTFFSLIYVLIIFFIGNEILNLYGNKFVISHTPLIILSLGYFTKSLSISELFMIMTKFQIQSSIILLVTLILNITLNYFLITPLGIIGASIATACSLIFLNISMPLYIFYKTKINTSIFQLRAYSE